MADTLTIIKSTLLFTQQRVQLAWDTRVRSRLDSSTGLETANTAQQAIGLDSSPSDHCYPSQKLNRISDFRFVEQPSLEFQVLPFRITWIMNIAISRGRKIRGKTPIVRRENVRGRLECCRFERVKWHGARVHGEFLEAFDLYGYRQLGRVNCCNATREIGISDVSGHENNRTREIRMFQLAGAQRTETGF